MLDALLSCPNERIWFNPEEGIEAACEYDDNSEIVHLLLERCENKIQTYEPRLLETAIWRDRVSVAEELLSRCCPSEEDLISAIGSGYEMLELVLANSDVSTIALERALDIAIEAEKVRRRRIAR